MSTVYAVATARGKAGLGVVRLSGPRAWASAEALCGPLPPERHAGLRTLRAPDGTVLDRGLVLCFGDGASYTGEPVVELHCHGAPAILRAVLDALAAQEGVRPAEPGEFTRRALENGRMDLAQVEGLADLLEAETELQRTQAWRVFSGELRGIVDGWRSSLVHALALVEATIDFADEDVPQDVTPEVERLVVGVRTEMEAQIAGLGISERIRDGFTVAIVGPPNVGKSTLINRLAGRELAIVSQFPGTTRDVIEVMLDLKGLPVTFLDTAGLRVGGDDVERIGIRRARERAAEADLRVVLLNEAQDQPALPLMPGDIVLTAKADLRSAPNGVSGLTGQGVEALLVRVHAYLSQRAAASTAFTRHRHRLALSDASTALGSVQLNSGALELTAERLWEALRALASILGPVDVEHVLDDVFASFCVGK